MDKEVITTRVGIVGAGPAGLMLSHLLAKEGVDNVVIDIRERDVIAHTHRAGILEAGSVRMLTETGVGGRVLTEGYEHSGIYLRFDGVSHHIDFKRLVGQTVTLYPQNEVFVDLANARERDGGDVRFGVSDTEVTGIDGDNPVISFTDSEGRSCEIHCEIVIGADGSRSQCRNLIPEELRTKHTKRYPFAWFGTLCEAPFSSDELIYCRSDLGLALISQRTETVQRMYFQCDPETKVEDWDDEQIWDHLDAIVAGPDGFTLKRGPIFEKTLLPFRSFVQTPMQHGRLSMIWMTSSMRAGSWPTSVRIWWASFAPSFSCSSTRSGRDDPGAMPSRISSAGTFDQPMSCSRIAGRTTSGSASGVHASRARPRP